MGVSTWRGVCVSMITHTFLHLGRFSGEDGRAGVEWRSRSGDQRDTQRNGDVHPASSLLLSQDARAWISLSTSCS